MEEEFNSNVITTEKIMSLPISSICFLLDNWAISSLVYGIKMLQCAIYGSCFEGNHYI